MTNHKNKWMWSLWINSVVFLFEPNVCVTSWLWYTINTFQYDFRFWFRWNCMICTLSAQNVCILLWYRSIIPMPCEWHNIHRYKIDGHYRTPCVTLKRKTMKAIQMNMIKLGTAMVFLLLSMFEITVQKKKKLYIPKV